ncbi:MAG: SGNH hydrolase domain-containing protein, partial [Actinomycetes bacterium]
EVSVALVGNSHAGQWLPALQEVAELRNWRVTTYIAGRCAIAGVRQEFPTAAESAGCRRWGEQVSGRLEQDRPDLVVVSNRTALPAAGASTPQESLAKYRRGYKKLLREWESAGLAVVALRDTPVPGSAGMASVPGCVAAHPQDLSRCGGDRGAWEPPEPLLEAAKAVDGPRLTVADLNDRICTARTCAGVVGGVLVYADGSHLTATYARTLAVSLDDVLHDALEKE